MFDLFTSKQIFKPSEGFSTDDRKRVYLAMHGKQIGLGMDKQYEDSIISQVYDHANDFDLKFKLAARRGNVESDYQDILESMSKPDKALEIQSNSGSKIWVRKTQEGKYQLKLKPAGDDTYSDPMTFLTLGGIAKLIKDTVKDSSASGGYKNASLVEYSAPRPVFAMGDIKMSQKHKDAGSLRNYAKKVEQFTKKKLASVPKETIQKANATMTRFFQDSKTAFSMRFRAQNLSSILGSNFMSQIQLKDAGKKVHSGGYLGPEARAKASTDMFGTVRDEAGKNGKQFEKYGYAGCSDFSKDVSLGGSVSHYGDVIVHFKKENIFGRATYTMDDSLGPSHNGILPGLVGMDGVTMGTGTTSYRATEGIQKIASDKAYAAAIEGPEKLRDAAQGYSSYIEMQYHGKLTIQQDVGQMCFTDESAMTKYLTKKSKKILKDCGIKVYVMRGRKPQQVSLDD